jgi:hypothetical protein
VTLVTGHRSLVTRVSAIAVAVALGACGSVDDEIQAESAAILARMPIGTPYGELLAAMRDLGFTCIEGRRQFSDRTGAMRDAAPHLSCDREQSQWLVCARRTRVILIQLNGRLSNILVNVGRFCS